MPLNEKLLALVLDELIPPRPERSLPGAGALGVGTEVTRAIAATPGLEPVIAKGLESVETSAQKRFRRGFVSLSRRDRADCLREVEQADAAFLPTLLMLAYVGYYGNDGVVAGLKGESHAPHPRGYEVEADDLSLLGAVRSRGKLYRDC